MPFHTQSAFNTLIILGAVCLGYFITISDLAGQWLTMDESLSHGSIIVGMSAFLIYKRLQHSEASNKYQSFGTILLLTSSFLWYLSASINLVIAEQLLLIPIIFSLTWSLFGLNSARQAALPILYLLFALPIWDHLTPYLVDLSSHVVMWAISLTSLPALIDGNSVLIPAGTIIIADGCSGLRYLVIATALASYIVIDSQPQIKNSLKLLLISIVLGLAVNWLRIFIIVMIAYATDMQSSLIEEHELFGWLLFAIVCTPIIILARNFKHFPINKHSADSPISFLRMAISGIAVFSGPALYLALHTATPKPPQIANWQEYGYQPITNNHPVFAAPQAKLLLKKVSSTASRETSIIVANWQQTADEKLTPYWPSPYNRERWHLIQTDIYNQTDIETKLLTLERKPYGQIACLAVQYQLGRQNTTNYQIAKLWQLKATLFGDNNFIAKLVILMPNTQSCHNSQDAINTAMLRLSSDAEHLIKKH